MPAADHNNPSDIPVPVPGGQTSLIDRINLGIYLRRYVKIVARRWWVVVIGVALGGVFMAWSALSAPDMYRAVTKIGITPRLKTVSSTQVQYLEALDNFYAENLNLILGVVKTKADARFAQQQMIRTNPPQLKIEAAKVASSFHLFADSSDRFYGKSYLTNWAREFIAYKNEMKDNTVAREAARTTDEIAKFTRKLEEARAAKDAFLRTNRIGSPLETGRAAQKRYEEAIDELRRVQTTLALEKQRSPKDIAEGASAETARDSNTPSNPKNADAANPDAGDPLARFASESKYSDLKLRLRGEQSEFDRLRPTLKTNHPYMRMLARSAQLLQENLQHQLDLIQEKREARIKFLDQQEANLNTLVNDLLKDVQAKSSIQYEHERLVKDESTLEKHLDDLQKQLMSFDPSMIDESQFNVVEEAVDMLSPYQPNRLLMILKGLFFGLLAGLASSYLLHRLDDRLELAQDVEQALHEPVLGQIPLVSVEESGGGRLLITQMDQYSFFAESIRGVRSAILLGNRAGKKQVIVVSSAVPGDGKTTFTVNFAATLALAGHRVLLVDADLRRGAAHAYFDIERAPGFSEVLAGSEHWADVVQSTRLASLHVMPTGQLPGNPGELLIGPVTQEFVKEARAEYDYIIFDCAPLTALDDTFSLVPVSDGLLFVVRSGQTSIRFAKTSLAAARHRGAEILGVVLNGITADNPHYYYHKYYHAYYRRTEGGPDSLRQMKPATRMASSRRSTPKSASISTEAQMMAGDMPIDLISQSKSKAEQLRLLRQAQNTHKTTASDESMNRPTS